MNKIGLEIKVSGIKALDGSTLNKFEIFIDKRPSNIDPTVLNTSDGVEYIKNSKYFKKLSENKLELERVTKEIVNDAISKLEQSSKKIVDRSKGNKWNMNVKVYFPKDDITKSN